MGNSEEWRPVKGYEGLYEVSNHGRVRGLDRIVGGPRGPRRWKGRVLAAPASGPGYPMVNLRRDGKSGHTYVHHLVAEAFIGPRPKGLHICHNDGDKTNNRVENLRYDTVTENLEDRRRHGTYVRPHSKKTHCRNGHEFSPENTYTPPGTVYRMCIKCLRDNQRRRRAEAKATQANQRR